MSDQPNDPQPPSPSMEERRRLNAACNGVPKYFTYPKPLPITEEERKHYEEVSARLPARRASGAKN